jgi:ParB family chromosome partitioning protein
MLISIWRRRWSSVAERNTKGLGRGLAALIGGDQQSAPAGAGVQPADSADVRYLELSISQITVNPHQPRTSFDEAALEELAASMRAVGVMQPVVVRRDGDGFELVAGERRLRAAGLAGLDSIPAVIRDADELASLEMALIENINREDLNAMDAARAYAGLHEQFGRTQEEIASRLGRSRSAVANTIRLLELPDEIQAMIEAGSLSEGHGRALLSIEDRRRQKKIAAMVAAKGLSVRETEALAKKEDTARKQRLGQPALVGQEVMDEATDAIYSAFRLPVKVRWAGKAGRIEIEFKGEEQLRQVIDKLEDVY